MSHFSVLICLPGDTELSNLEKVIGETMERWNENRDVEEYRDYESGSPDEFWFAGALREDSEQFGVATFDTELAAALKKATSWDQVKPEEKARSRMGQIAAARDWVTKFGSGPWTWAQVVEAYNATFHPGGELARVGDTGPSGRIFVDDEGRAYTLSTRNPESKWDYWRIGGRWRNYFIARQAGPGLISTERSWDSPDEGEGLLSRLRVDGGPVAMLNFDLMRDEWAAKELARFDRWHQIVAEHGQPPAWKDLCGLVELGELTVEEARRQYSGHAAIRAARNEDVAGWNEGPEEEFGTSREEFERLARLNAVPGYALVTVEGEWMAPGEMGWFGMSTDSAAGREVYKAEANRYLESLDPSTLVVVLDLHI